jgi:pimeloyl-ACP methyl ester carboxylesterase
VYQPGQFATLATPTLILAGSDSVPVVREATDRAAAAIPNAEIHVLQEHGHFAHKTDPIMVSAIIRQFIAQ